MFSQAQEIANGTQYDDENATNSRNESSLFQEASEIYFDGNYTSGYNEDDNDTFPQQREITETFVNVTEVETTEPDGTYGNTDRPIVNRPVTARVIRKTSSTEVVQSTPETMHDIANYTQLGNAITTSGVDNEEPTTTTAAANLTLDKTFYYYDHFDYLMPGMYY